ncbi:hypothetical protein FB567DRAFT_425176, partial [Paraphoma chrysanthemicola]
AQMSRSAFRQTTRFKDRAYLLLGLINICFPRPYVKGWKAFGHPQEEVLKVSTDQLIL